MGVYIKGMEMPTGFVKIELGYDADGEPMAMVGDEVFDVIPVPPHGRLIDADALKEAKSVNNIAILMDIEDASTIIPAEEEP